MDLLEAAQTISDRFNTLIATPLSLTTQYDNAALPADKGDVWCRFSIQWASRKQVSMGAPDDNRQRRLGNAVAQVFIRLNKGDAEALTICEKIELEYGNVSLPNGLVLKTPETLPGVRTDDGYWQTNVVCPFLVDNYS
jgi:hypothetical protein